MKKYLRYLGPVLITGLFVLAIYLLYQKLRAYSLEEIRLSIEQVSYASIALSIFLTIINYIILVGYDWLASRPFTSRCRCRAWGWFRWWGRP